MSRIFVEEWLLLVCSENREFIFKLVVPVLCVCRLWGDHGQAMLEGAQVCVINATSLGTEILKGLVLPGIGGFTVVDGGIVTEEDIGVK